jgi:hypothetical protein
MRRARTRAAATSAAATSASNTSICLTSYTQTSLITHYAWHAWVSVGVTACVACVSLTPPCAIRSQHTPRRRYISMQWFVAVELRATSSSTWGHCTSVLLLRGRSTSRCAPPPAAAPVLQLLHALLQQLQRGVAPVAARLLQLLHQCCSCCMLCCNSCNSVLLRASSCCTTVCARPPAATQREHDIGRIRGMQVGVEGSAALSLWRKR